MTESSPEPVRRSLILHAALEVLAEDGGPVKRAEVLHRVGQRVTFTPYEDSSFREGDPTTRWANHLSWYSTNMKMAGWITKSSQGWQITDAGREALASHPDDGEGLDTEASQAYRDWAKERRRDEPDFTRILDAALDFIEPGEWTTCGDLAASMAADENAIWNALWSSTSEAAHRVILKSGKPSPDHHWPDGRTETQREVLEQEGVEFDEAGVASESQRIRTADFRDYLEQQGILAIAPKRAWLVRGSSVDGHDLIELWRREGYVSLKAAQLRLVDSGISRQELKDIIDDDYAQSAYSAKAARLDEFHNFLTRMKDGDLIVTTSHNHLYLGTVTGDAEYVRSADNLSNLRRAVIWQGDGVSYDDLPKEVKARFNQQYDVVEMTQQLDILESLLSEDPAEVVAKRHELVLPDATDDLAESLNVDREWLNECIELLRDRPQLIFYGPPGTGKTYIAQKLATHLAGDNVRLVQFHPAYSYEDFFEGYRPTPSGTFELRPGPLRKTVDAARENQGTAYVLIIDEINRGNLAKIFGELYFLLEYRDQNVDLLYATDDDKGFTLPDNVFIIGTMNTADRSIALVDAAMRRRFAFVSLHPSRPPVRDVLRRWLVATGRDPGVADLLDELNARIDDPDFRIGPSYFMRDAVYSEGGLERAWRTAILPLLEEHHYGDGTDVGARYGLDAIRARVTARTRIDQDRDDSAADPA
jgi:5-methylcytosine-specific restriction protein B